MNPKILPPEQPDEASVGEGSAKARWENFQPPPLPEASKLQATIERARKMTPTQVLQVSISAGIHNADGSLTAKYS